MPLTIKNWNEAKYAVLFPAIPSPAVLTEWYIQSGVAGIFSVCLSSEMYQLSNEERLAIARRVVEKAAGRVPVVAGGRCNALRV